MNLLEFQMKFGTEKACRDWLAIKRWGKNPVCPHCKAARISTHSNDVLFTSMKKGISSIKLGKYIEVTQKTAWFMLRRIREVMNSGNSPFDGMTEV